MINEKYIPYISVALIILSIILIITGSMFIPSDDNSLSNNSVETEYTEKIFNKEEVIDINIVIDDTDFNWLLDNATLEEYRSCTVIINGTTFNNVGIRPKGNSSLKTVASDNTTDRFSFKLDFGEYIDGQTCFGLEKISLNNMMSDKSYLKEYLSYDLFNYMGVPTPAYAYANIKINGEDWGLYLAVENIEESFISRYFGSIEGNLYKPEGNMDNQQEAPMDRGNMGMPGANMVQGNNGNNIPVDENRGGITSKASGADLKYNGDSPSDYSAIIDNAVFKTTTDEDFEKVIEMIKNLNEGTNLEKYLDVDEILRYFAVNTFLVNLDSYAGNTTHNYYLYEKNGIFRILPWDLNMSFAGFRINDGSEAVNFPIDNPVTESLEAKPLIGKLLEVDEYKEIYHNYLNQIVEEYINSGRYEETINNIDNLIDQYVKNDKTAFFTYEDYKLAVSELITFGRDRAKSIIAQLEGTQPSTTYGTIETTVDIQALGGTTTMKPENNMNRPGEMPNMGGGQNMNERPNIDGSPPGEDINMNGEGKIPNMGGGQNINERSNINMRPPTVDIKNDLNTDNGSLKTSLYINIALFILLIGGLIFVNKFRRRKYQS